MMNKYKNRRWALIAFIPALCILWTLSLFAATENRASDIVSICDRTEQVRIAIQKEVATERFTSGAGGAVRCQFIGARELAKIEYLQIIGKEISSLKNGDFAGLDGLRMLDMEGNRLEALNPSALSGLKNLEHLVLARNRITSLSDALAALPQLKSVDLSGNKLSFISPDAFSGNLNLKAVFLSDNQISKLPEGIFQKNHSLEIIDLSRNRLRRIPSSFTPDKSALQSLDLSQNLIEKLDKNQLSGLSGLQVLNLSGNPVETLDKQGSFLKIFYPAVYVITSTRQRFNLSLNHYQHPNAVIAEPESRVFQGVERLRSFVRAHWHMPLTVAVSFSSGGQSDLRDPGLRMREERLLLRQLEEVREAYRRAAFDFYDVQIRFVHPASLQKAPVLSFNKPGVGFVIVLKAPARGSEGASLISDHQILELLADHFDRGHSVAWFKKETRDELSAALKRDFEKAARMDDELRFDIIRLDDLIDTAMDRMNRADGKKFFSETELFDARFIQFRVLLNLQRLENTLARWRLAESDPEFPYRAEVRMLLADSAEIYRTYLDWFLLTVVGNRSTLNVFDETWYHRNPIFKILDSEVPAGFFNLEGRISTRIPAGAVQDLLKSRLSAPLLLNFLRVMRSLDEKVSETEMTRSPLRAQMIQSQVRIARNRQALAQNKMPAATAFKELLDARVKETVKFPLYRVTAGVAGVIGDTRVSNPAPAITDEQMKDMKAHLKPGDILVERTDHYLSNAFLGGFWPHGILYLGPKDQWSRMKLADGTILAEDPWIAKHILPNYFSAKDDHPALVMEAISEGVVFNSLEEAAQKDYIGIFRPKFSPAEQEAKIAAAIKRALKYHGRPYDFGFDFFTDDKLVCTELLYRAYHPDINFLVQKQAVRKPDPPVPGMIKKAGRDTMPAGEIVKLALYMLDHREPKPSIGYAGQTLEFVRLYMKPGEGRSARIFEGAEGIEILRRSVQ